MTSLTLYDWLWIAFLFSIVITSAYLIGRDTKEVRREEREADDFQDSIDEAKHTDYWMYKDDHNPDNKYNP